MFCFAIGHCHWSSILIRPYNVQILGLNIYSYIEDNDLAFYKTQKSSARKMDVLDWLLMSYQEEIVKGGENPLDMTRHHLLAETI